MENLIVIAGSGNYPRHVVEGAKKAGVSRVDVLAVKGSTERATCKAADGVHWITLGGIAEGIRWMGYAGWAGRATTARFSPGR